ncbi:phospholipid scramblase 1-like [Periophthalmus magnuspinnatus]|uniref:phospholipid scramblase 1-like n=1 Tax=Periophthalmus magnuspinnatus TaxID=409849 RepID=UPI00145AEC52|nr:phospholipid scramblase 1-like [Periophthalmus magnuspinnatus]
MAFPADSAPYYIGMQNTVHPFPNSSFPPPGPPPPYNSVPPAAPAPIPNPGPSIPGCPPGLEYLTQIDQILVQQKVDYAEMIIGWEMSEVEIQSPPGFPIGYVEQNWHPFLPKFTVLDATRSAQLKIKGPFCDCKCCSDVVFEVLSRDEEAVVGQISKQWGGFLQEGFSDADNFGISFPMDLDVKVKAVLLGAVFLIDFMYFETNKNDNNN